MMKVYLFVFGLVVTSSSAIRGQSYTRLKREVVSSDGDAVIDTTKVAASQINRYLHPLILTPSKCTGKGGKKIKGSAIFRVNCIEDGGNAGGLDEGTDGGDEEDIYNDPPLGTDVDTMETPAPTFKDYHGKDGDGDAIGTEADALTSSPTASSAATPSASPAATPNAGQTAAPTAYATGNEIAGGADGEGGESNYNGTATAAPASSPSIVPTVPTSTTEGQGNLDRVVSCDGDDESALGSLTPKYVGYKYSVKTHGEKYTLTEILYAIESAILEALDDGNVPDCGVSRKLETNVHRRLDGEVVGISSDPLDMPYSNVDCKEGEDCNVLIQGNLTAYLNAEADDQQALNVIECDIITIIQELMMSMSPGEIGGLENITYLGVPMCKTPAGAFTPTTEATNTSDVLPAGLIAGTAVGGMCMVLLGLLVVRQRMSRRREDGTTVDGSGMVKASSRSLSVTVDQNDSHQTFDVTPTSTYPDGSTLGISASHDSGSIWGAVNDKSSDIERGRERANMETSDDNISFGSGSASQPVSPDPPSMECGESLNFEPTVQEEEDLTHDVRFQPIIHEEQHLTHEC